MSGLKVIQGRKEGRKEGAKGTNWTITLAICNAETAARVSHHKERRGRELRGARFIVNFGERGRSMGDIR